MCKTLHNLDYERTDDMSVLSDFFCGIDEMDSYIHNHLQTKVNSDGKLESYIVRENNEIVAMTAIKEDKLRVKKSDGNMFEIDCLEIEYLAVKKELRQKGIGETADQGTVL